MFAVTVLFKLHPGSNMAFLSALRENATYSIATEPGRHQFDICAHSSDPDTVFLYEVYQDSAAFDAHLAAPHTVRFFQKSEALVSSREVITYDEVWQ